MIEIIKNGVQFTIVNRPQFNFVIINPDDLSSVAPYTTSLEILDTPELRGALGITDPLLSNQGTYDVEAIFLGYSLNAKLTLKSYDFVSHVYSCELLIEFFTIPDESLQEVAGAWALLNFDFNHDYIYVKTVSNGGANNDLNTGVVYITKGRIYEELAQDISLNDSGLYGTEHGMNYKPYITLKAALENILPPGTVLPSGLERYLIDTSYKYYMNECNKIMNHNSFNVHVTYNNTAPWTIDWGTAVFDAGDGADYLANQKANYIPLRRGLFYTISGMHGGVRTGGLIVELDAITIRDGNVNVYTIDAQQTRYPTGASLYTYSLFVSPFHYESPTQQFVFTGFTFFGFKYNQSGTSVTGTDSIRVKAHPRPKSFTRAWQETFEYLSGSAVNAKALLPDVNTRDFVKEVLLYLGYLLRFDISTKQYKIVSLTPTVASQSPEVLKLLSVSYESDDTIEILDKRGRVLSTIAGTTGRKKEVKFKALSADIETPPGRQGVTQPLSIEASPSAQRWVQLKQGNAEIVNNQHDVYNLDTSDDFRLTYVPYDTKQIETWNTDHITTNSGTASLASGYFYKYYEKDSFNVAPFTEVVKSAQRVKCLCRVTREFIQDALANFRLYTVPELGGEYIIERIDGLGEDLLCEITFKRYG